MSSWSFRALSEVLSEKTRNGIHKGTEYQGQGVPVIKMGEVYSSPYVGVGPHRDLLMLSEAEIEKLSVRPDDLLFCRTSLVAEGVGRCALVRDVTPGTSFASNLIRVRIDSTKADCRFIHWVFRSPLGEALRMSIARGTSVTTITGPDLAGLLIPLPPLPEQRAIAEVLGALDDKIESNRRIWKLRLELAGSAFRRAAKEAETTTPLGELYEVGLSGVWGQDEPGGKATVATSCLRGRDLEDFVAGGVVESPVRFISEKQLSSRVFQNGEIWTAGSGSLGPSLLITEGVARLWENQLTYSNFVKRLVPIGGHDMAEVAWNAVVDTWRNDGFAAFRTGTAMPNLDPSALLAGVQVPVVANESREEIALLTNAALDPQVLMENLALARLRDTLLPALLSGRIRVPAAADLVDA